MGKYGNTGQNQSISCSGIMRRTTGIGPEIRVVELFKAESVNSIEMQKGGWQSIPDHFRKHTEQN
jgi:hypothetical protein